MNTLWLMYVSIAVHWVFFSFSCATEKSSTHHRPTVKFAHDVKSPPVQSTRTAPKLRTQEVKSAFQAEVIAANVCFFGIELGLPSFPLYEDIP